MNCSASTSWGASLRTQILNTYTRDFVKKRTLFLSVEQAVAVLDPLNLLSSKPANVAGQDEARNAGYLDWVYFVD